MADPQPKKSEGMAESVTPQPSTESRALESTIDSYALCLDTPDYVEACAVGCVEALREAGFRLIPPGWRVVKTETDGPTLGGQSYDVIVEEWDG